VDGISESSEDNEGVEDLLDEDMVHRPGISTQRRIAGLEAVSNRATNCLVSSVDATAAPESVSLNQATVQQTRGNPMQQFDSAKK
jgi:hypothetical protein